MSSSSDWVWRPQQAAGEEVDHPAELGHQVQHVAHHQAHAVSLGRGDHGVALRHGQRQGLLAEDVLAGGGGVQHHLGMEGVRRGDDDGINIRPVQQGTMIRLDRHPLQRTEARGGARIDVADGDEHRLRDDGELLRQPASHAPAADQSDP
jgi:hypothetical protein